MRTGASSSTSAGNSRTRPANCEIVANGRISRMSSVGPRTALSISVVLPAYNEEAIIERTVRHVGDVLADLARDFEIIVTNDGSKDGTGAVLAGLQASDPQLHLQVVTHAENRGYGAALASGFDAAQK